MPSRSMNTAQARVIDPILSTYARGYTNAEFIGQLILPPVFIPTRGVRVLAFGKEAFRKLNTRRAPGADTARVQYGYASDPVALHQDSLEGIVPFEHQEDASKVPGVNLAQGAIDMVMGIIALGKECEIAEKVRNPATYGENNTLALAGAAKWSDDASDPAKDIKAANEQIRKRTGRYGNTLTLSPAALNALTLHPKITARFKYTSSESVTTDMLAKYFDIQRVIVGRAVVLPEGAGDNTDALDVWGNDAILTYSPNSTDYRVPAFGYTYRLAGHPQVEAPYNERNIKSWVYPTTEEWAAYVTGADAGFLFQNAA